MTDGIGRTTQPTPIQPTDNENTGIGGAAQPNQTGMSKGVGSNTGVTFEHKNDQFHFMIDGKNHAIDVPAENMKNAVVSQVFTELDDANWQGTDFSFGMLMRAIAEAAKNSNKLQEFMNSVHTGDIQKMIDAFDKLALEKKDLAIKQGVTQMVSGGVQAGFGAAGMSKKGVDHAQSLNAVGGGASSGVSGIGSIWTAGDQEDITLAEKGQSLASEYMNRTGGLRDKFGGAFDKAQQAFQQVKQDEGSWYNQQAQALKNL